MELYKDSNGVTWVLEMVRPKASPNVTNVVAWIDPSTSVKYDPLPVDVGPLLTAELVRAAIEKYAAGHKRDVVLVVHETAPPPGSWLVLVALVVGVLVLDELGDPWD